MQNFTDTLGYYHLVAFGVITCFFLTFVMKRLSKTAPIVTDDVNEIVIIIIIIIIIIIVVVVVVVVVVVNALTLLVG